ncbi:YggT family protein [Caldicellulosiruptoraceae bacterium PP1]
MVAFILKLVDKLFSFLEFAIVLDALLSWFIPDSFNKYRRITNTIVSPILEPVRRLTERFIRIPMIDISPIIAIFLLELLRTVVIRFLAAIFYW